MSTSKMAPERGRGQEESDWKLQNRGGRDSSEAAVISHIAQQGCKGQGSGSKRPVCSQGTRAGASFSSTWEGARSPLGSRVLSVSGRGLLSLRISFSRAWMDSLIEEMVACNDEICSRILQ